MPPEITLKKRNPRPTPRKILYPDLEISQILAWADAFHARHGKWPSKDSGPVIEGSKTTWCGINIALQRGHRGLTGGSSLALMLQEWRGTRNIKCLPVLSYEQILSWADAHFEHTGRWPNKTDGAVEEAVGEKWSVIDIQLRHGGRGLPGGTSLARLIAERRSIRNQTNLLPFTTVQILEWADAFHSRTGGWPGIESGPIPEAPGENWRKVNNALMFGLRGLSGGSSLAQLLEDNRGVRNSQRLPPLSYDLILTWADAHYARTGRWPNRQTGAVEEAPGETWGTIDFQLAKGGRGLPGSMSLARLIADRRGVRNKTNLIPFTEEQILEWADAHYARTGRWPSKNSGAILEAPDENWQRVHDALVQGLRGVPGDSSLAKFLDQHRRGL